MPDPITITIGDDDPISVEWGANLTVQGALEKVYNQIRDSSKFSFAIEYYGTFQLPPDGPLGYFVIMLNGTFDTPGQGKYWEITYQGQPATKGIDYLTLNPGDNVTFLNEAYSEQKHATSSVGIKHRKHVARRN